MLFLMRHGQRADNVAKENPAETPESLDDPHLTQRGRIQAQAAGDKIKEILQSRGVTKIKVVSSPFLRCLMTAQEVAKRLGVNEITVDLSLSEMMHSSFYKESPMNTLIFRSPDKVKNYVQLPLKLLERPGPAFPETFPMFSDRAVAFFSHYQKEIKPDECYILVSHGYSVNYVLEDRKSFDPFKGVDYCCLSAFENGNLILQQHHEKI